MSKRKGNIYETKKPIRKRLVALQWVWSSITWYISMLKRAKARDVSKRRRVGHCMETRRSIAPPIPIMKPDLFWADENCNA